MLKILIVEGNVKESRDKAVSTGSLAQSDLYEKTLRSLADDVACSIVYPADDHAVLPQPAALAAFDGITWTGSALNIYDRCPEVDRQTDFMKLCLGQESRVFGSCWGLQVASVAAGGEVAANPEGREIGIARNIRITEEGFSHPMYAGKPRSFDAVTIHLDHVVRLPANTTVLSGNDISEVQAVEIRCGKSVFWGVQYHPEFDLEYISGLIRKYRKTLIDEGIRTDDADVEKWANDLAAAQHGEDEGSLRKSYCLNKDVLDPHHRLRELSNWISYLRREGGRASGNVQHTSAQSL